MIKAVIFDFFGVLGMRGLKLFKKRYLGDDKVKRLEAKALQNQLDTGTIGYDEFIGRLAQISGTDRQTVLSYTENYKPNQELLDYIRDKLKPHYKLGIISNSGADWVTRIIGEDNKRLFDDIVLSYEVGSVKPDPKIYKMSAQNLGVETHECVFIDDISVYCDGAEAVGMKAVAYGKFSSFKEELERLLTSDSDN